MKVHDSPILIGDLTVNTHAIDVGAAYNRIDNTVNQPEQGKEVDGVRDKVSC